MKNRNNWLTFFVSLFFSSTLLAVNGWIPVDDTELTLPDGRMVSSIRTGDHSHKIVLKNGKKVLWSYNFEFEYDRLWDDAFFVPIKPKKYFFDLNHDGYFEIAIATWDGGNNMEHRDAVIFTVKENSLEYFGRHPFNLEYGTYVYP